MKNKSWLRLTGWLLALVMILTVMPVATFAETDGEVNSDTIKSPTMQKRPAEADVTSEAAFTYTNASGKATEPASMNPNEANQMKLAVSGLNAHNEIGNNTVMAVTLPDNITVSPTLQGFSSNAVDATLDDGKLLLSWKGEKQDSFEATVAVLPHMPTNHDLSGSYVLGTARKSMLGTRTFRDTEKGRDKLYASEYTETDSKIRPGTDENPVWVLEHVSGNYYTVRAQNTHKYIYISPVANGKYSASSLYLVEGTSETAQKILVTDVGGGYYSFTYRHSDGKDYAINNSGNDKAGNSAVRGFGCWTYAGYDNEKFKLYSPSAFDNSATVDLSGSWVIINTSGKVSLTSETSRANRLSGMTYTLNNGVTVAEDDAVAFNFEHVIRDWYTVRTDAGYLNITAEGAKISSTPQRLMVKTDDNYATIMLTTGEYVNSTTKYCSTYALKFEGNKIFGSVISSYTANTRMQLVSPSGFANAETVSFLFFNKNGGTGTKVPETIVGEAGEKIILPELDGTKNGEEFIGWSNDSDVTKVVTGTNHTCHPFYTAGSTYTLQSGTNTLYAVYNTTKKNVRFGIRIDGVIQDEPNGYPAEKYTGHFWLNDDLKIGKWIVDIDSTKPVDGYTVTNKVTANLKYLPTAEQISEGLKNEGAKLTFDPNTQYIHWYVLKYTTTNGGEWHVDGVIRNKAKVSVTYDTNAPAGVDKTKVTQMPGSYQVDPGTDILIGTDKGDTNIKRPGLTGYFFMGWNTKADGSGEYYHESTTVHLTKNLNLYAQWISEADNPLEIRITSDWTKGKIGYVGAKIKLTAALTGFEGKQYILQWQYSTDKEIWYDVPDAHDETYTYILDETTTNYFWRVVAQDIR